MSETRRFKLVDSTNNKIKEIAKSEIKDGIVIVATQQTEGRGSGGRVWHSPKGGLYLSIVLSPQKPDQPTDLSILAGVAAAQAVRDIMPKLVDVSVKWPNDILVSGKKVGGILCESLGKGRESFCVVGIGLNVNTKSEELVAFQNDNFPATSFIETVPGSDVALSRVEDVLLNKLLSLYKLYQEEGFEPIRYLWEKNCRHMEHKIEIAERPPLPKGQKQPQSWQGLFVGIDEKGGLMLIGKQGNKTYYSCEIVKIWD